MAGKTRIAVIFGGKSGEHEVSLVSAANVIEAIDKEKYNVVFIPITKQGEWKIYNGSPEFIASGRCFDTARDFSPWNLPKVCDYVLPILHGPNGEDGTVQGILELLNIPYGGCGVLGCAAVMDKIVAKKIFAAEGIPQTPYVALNSRDLQDPERKAAKFEEIKNSLKLPLFVKPANMGSSVGITKVHELSQLEDALALAAHYDCRLVVEQGVDCRELETGAMGNEDVEISEVGEILPADDFYSYDDKYKNGVSKLLIPAPITKEQRETIRDYARRAYTAAGCFGFSRCDFMMDKHTGQIYINEINAIPGFTNISMFPKLFMQVGYTYPQIIERIIELGYERYNAKNNR